MIPEVNTATIMGRVQGWIFKVRGPFLVADLGVQATNAFEDLPVGEHGMEEVQFGQKTQAHHHDFPSFYKSSGLDVECEGKRFVLPQRALTLVLPGVSHSWVPKKKEGTVGSVDSRHGKQVLALAA